MFDVLQVTPLSPCYIYSLIQGNLFVFESITFRIAKTFKKLSELVAYTFVREVSPIGLIMMHALINYIVSFCLDVCKPF
jgi:hypothetical protein